MSAATKPIPDPGPAYDADAHAWCLHQAALLRAGRFEALDVENLAEEIETLGRSEYRSLVSALRIVLLHLAKWDHQPERCSRSWRNSIAYARNDARQVLAESPSLRSRLAEAADRAWQRARLEASTETDMPLRTFPQGNPYSLTDLLDRPVGTED